MLAHKMFDNSFFTRGLAKNAARVEKHEAGFAFLNFLGSEINLLSTFPFLSTSAISYTRDVVL